MTAFDSLGLTVFTGTDSLALAETASLDSDRDAVREGDVLLVSDAGCIEGVGVACLD